MLSSTGAPCSNAATSVLAVTVQAVETLLLASVPPLVCRVCCCCCLSAQVPAEPQLVEAHLLIICINGQLCELLCQRNGVGISLRQQAQLVQLQQHTHSQYRALSASLMLDGLYWGAASEAGSMRT